MDLPSPPIVIRESRWKAGAQLAGVAFFGGAFLLGHPRFPDSGSFFVVAIIGGLGLWTLAQLIRPSTLVLDEGGFQVDQFWRSWRVRWSQVSNFRIVQRSRSITRYIAYDYVPDRLSWNEAPRNCRPTGP